MKTKPFEICPSKSPVLKCFQILNGRIMDPQCTTLCVSYIESQLICVVTVKHLTLEVEWIIISNVTGRFKMNIRFSFQNNRCAVVLCSYSSVRDRRSNTQRNYKLIIVVVSIDLIRIQISRFRTMEYIKEISCFLFVTS